MAPQCPPRNVPELSAGRDSAGSPPRLPTGGFRKTPPSAKRAVRSGPGALYASWGGRERHNLFPSSNIWKRKIWLPVPATTLGSSSPGPISRLFAHTPPRRLQGVLLTVSATAGLLLLACRTRPKASSSFLDVHITLVQTADEYLATHART